MKDLRKVEELISLSNFWFLCASFVCAERGGVDLGNIDYYTSECLF